MTNAGPSWLLPLLYCIFVAACREPRLRQLCRFGPEKTLIRGGGSFIRDVDLTRRGERFLAAWTDASGTQVLELDQEGRALGTQYRVGPPSVSIDVVATQSGFIVVMLRPGHLIWGGGSAMMTRLDTSGSPRGHPVFLGRAGYYSQGITIASRRGTPIVAWQDGTPGGMAIMLSGGMTEPRQVSARGVNGCCPFFITRNGEVELLYGQYEVEQEQGAVLLQQISESEETYGRRELIKTMVSEPWPVATVTGKNLDIIYRDRRRWDTRDQLVFIRFDENNERFVGPERLGRYDGRSPATLLTNGNVFVTFAVRSWSREQIIALDRFDAQGQRLGAEMHVFADHVRFTDVDAVRAGDRYLVLYAEDEPQQRVWFAQVHCKLR